MSVTLIGVYFRAANRCHLNIFLIRKNISAFLKASFLVCFIYHLFEAADLFYLRIIVLQESLIGTFIMDRCYRYMIGRFKDI